MASDPSALAAALAKVQSELPKLERDRTVTIEPKTGKPYSYSYSTLANLSEVVLPLLGKHGLSFVAMPGVGSDGKMCVRYRLLHESGESLDGEFPISGEGGIQMIGGRITYARRYCLAALVGVAADEDDEARLAEGDAPRTAQRQQRTGGGKAQQASGPTAQRATETIDPDAPWTSNQQRRMMALFGEFDVTDRDERMDLSGRILRRRISSANELTVSGANQIIDALATLKTGFGGPGNAEAIRNAYPAVTP